MFSAAQSAACLRNGFLNGYYIVSAVRCAAGLRDGFLNGYYTVSQLLKDGFLNGSDSECGATERWFSKRLLCGFSAAQRWFF